jgi:phosphoenolpyruvate-protein kinase (PTS system EI component)
MRPSERVLRGIPAADGFVEGVVTVPSTATPNPATGVGGRRARRDALDALQRVGRELAAVAESMRTLGWPAEAEILETNRLMADDPTLAEHISTLARDRPAEVAVIDACEQQASRLCGLSDPLLAARADDIRQIGRRAAKLLTRQRLVAPAGSILVTRELGPADVADLVGTSIRGIALAAGALMSHAAIMARGLGLPMVVALGDSLMETPNGEQMLLDGTAGIAVLYPTEQTVATYRNSAGQPPLHGTRPEPTTSRSATRQTPTLLCNAASLAEVEAGLSAGASGVGLLRTEIPYLDASWWPSEATITLTLAPLLMALRARTATVRLFDFGDDKTPPFLNGCGERGVAILLQHADECSAQIRAILRCGLSSRLRLLVPMVESADQLASVRALVNECARECGPVVTSAPPVGAMIETPQAVSNVAEIVAVADFLSIGTNDLIATTLGFARGDPRASATAAAEPAVLRHVARVIEAAREASIGVAVCGEAVAAPAIAKMLVGLGVNELSVAPSRLAVVAAAVGSSADSFREPDPPARSARPARHRTG